ncbi:hypothetical protein B0H13DRAFT_2331946 [Mycena leptocephala]|nr:hypothetical protein B0H13DRAFT_2331946 [Mycena leptocephala]
MDPDTDVLHNLLDEADEAVPDLLLEEDEFSYSRYVIETAAAGKECIWYQQATVVDRPAVIFARDCLPAIFAIDAGFRLNNRIEDHVPLPLERGERIEYFFGQTDLQRGECPDIKFYCCATDGEIVERAWVLLIANAWYRHHPVILRAKL